MFCVVVMYLNWKFFIWFYGNVFNLEVSVIVDGVVIVLRVEYFVVEFKFRVMFSFKFVYYFFNILCVIFVGYYYCVFGFNYNNVF